MRLDEVHLRPSQNNDDEYRAAKTDPSKVDDTSPPAGSSSSSDAVSARLPSDARVGIPPATEKDSPLVNPGEMQTIRYQYDPRIEGTLFHLHERGNKPPRNDGPAASRLSPLDLGNIISFSQPWDLSQLCLSTDIASQAPIHQCAYLAIDWRDASTRAVFQRIPIPVARRLGRRLINLETLVVRYPIGSPLWCFDVWVGIVEGHLEGHDALARKDNGGLRPPVTQVAMSVRRFFVQTALAAIRRIRRLAMCPHQHNQTDDDSTRTTHAPHTATSTSQASLPITTATSDGWALVGEGQASGSATATANRHPSTDGRAVKSSLHTIVFEAVGQPSPAASQSRPPATITTATSDGWVLVGRGQDSPIPYEHVASDVPLPAHSRPSRFSSQRPLRVTIPALTTITGLRSEHAGIMTMRKWRTPALERVTGDFSGVRDTYEVSFIGTAGRLKHFDVLADPAVIEDVLFRVSLERRSGRLAALETIGTFTVSYSDTFDGPNRDTCRLAVRIKSPSPCPRICRTSRHPSSPTDYAASPAGPRKSSGVTTSPCTTPRTSHSTSTSPKPRGWWRCRGLR